MRRAGFAMGATHASHERTGLDALGLRVARTAQRNGQTTGFFCAMQDRKSAERFSRSLRGPPRTWSFTDLSSEAIRASECARDFVGLLPLEHQHIRLLAAGNLHCDRQSLQIG